MHNILTDYIEVEGNNCKYGHEFDPQCERCIARSEMQQDLLSKLPELLPRIEQELVEMVGENQIHDKEDDVSKYHWMKVGLNEERSRIRTLLHTYFNNK